MPGANCTDRPSRGGESDFTSIRSRLRAQVAQPSTGVHASVDTSGSELVSASESWGTLFVSFKMSAVFASWASAVPCSEGPLRGNALAV